ncbi:trypsin-like peptidase domain-containing protein [Nonomuraea candida]|uniref:trypsin-like peptidase domain-containing protein n=1 Tax=Nonomuraea candida TaxID=359159 RepID=UPI00069398C5|nr:trypsin-like peptidase domain-containing protein [Nonomuraea candida]
MTDETRPGEGRTPSDSPEPQGRPDFLPADDGSEPGRRPEPPASFGSSWGDPSGRQEVLGAPPYESRPYDASSSGGPSYGDAPPPSGPAYSDVPPPGGASYGSSAQDNPTQTGPQFGAPSFGPPDGGARSYDAGPSFGPPEDGARPYDSGPSFGPPDGGARSYDNGPSFGPPDGTTRSYDSPAFGSTDGGTRAYDGPFFGSPDGGARSYDGPPFGSPGGQPPYGGGGGAAPPPPRQALPMGPGWAPPPPGGGQGAARRMPGTAFLVSLAVVIALVASVLGSVSTYLLTRPTSANDPSYSLGPIPTGATNRAPDSVAGVAARVLPSVVSLEVGNGTNTEGATGSGFLIKNGYVVTNNHVVSLAANGGEIRIMFNNRKTTSGRIVGRDPGSDLAVVKPEQTFGTPEITLGNSDQVVVGDPVIAIGSPLGLTGTVTTGIVSSLNRPVIAGDETGTSSEEPAYISAIQTDAAINPGNSGGPLVNGRGEVVGVNSAIATLGRSMSSQGGSIGLGFAIPVNQTRRVAEELITTGKAKRPKIGIVLDKDYRGVGVKIASEPAAGQQPVTAGGPADQAGLKAGDVILEIDGLPLQDGNELIALIRSKEPGSKISVKYQRDGQERSATLTVVAEDEPTPSPS